MCGSMTIYLSCPHEDYAYPPPVGSLVNESMSCSLLLAPIEWRIGTVPALLKAQCTLHNKQAVIIVNGELGQYQLHSRH